MQADKRPLEPTRTIMADPEKEQSPINFSRCRTLEDVLREVKRMASRKEFLPTSDGKVKFSAKQLAQRITRAAELAVRATRDPEEPLVTKMVGPDELDEIFSQNGITSTSGLREAMVRVMRGKGNISGEVFSLANEIQEQGEFNPIQKLSEDQFIQKYPRAEVPLEVAKGMTDDEIQPILRWQSIEQAQVKRVKQEQVQQLRDWQDERSRVGFRQEWITQPTSTDGYAQYGKAQEANRIQREAKEAEARRKHFAELGGVGNMHSISAKIAEIMGGGKAKFSYEGLNWARGAKAMPEPKMTRTYSLPIEGAPGHMITVTLFSEAEIPERGVPREMPENFQGVLVESVDQLSVLSGGKVETAEQKQVIELARVQMKKVEAQVKSQFGIDLGIDKKLAAMVQ